MPVFFTEKEALEHRAELLADCDSIREVAANEKRDLTADETKTLDQKLQAWKDSEADVDRAKEYENAKRQSMLRQATGGMVHREDPNIGMAMDTQRQYEQTELVATHGGNQVFTSSMFGSPERAAMAAQDAGHWLLAQLGGNKQSMEYCERRGQSLAVDSTFRQSMDQRTDVANLGGVTVPTVISSSVIAIRDRYGVFPMITYRHPMSGEKENIPRELRDLLVQKPGETNAIPTDDLTFDDVKLVAVDGYVLVYVSHQMFRGSVVAIANRVTRSMGIAKARQVDWEAFRADGSNTAPDLINRIPGSFGKVGMLQPAATGGIANAGRVTASGAGWPGVAAQDFSSLVAALPDKYFADNRTNSTVPENGANEGPVWVMSRSFYSTVVEPYLEAGGGNRKFELAQGSPRMLKGYPIYFSVDLPTQEGAAGDIMCVFGNFHASTVLGDREQMSIAQSAEHRFAHDQIAYRCRSAWDINLYDLGTDTGTPEAGGVVALVQA